MIAHIYRQAFDYTLEYNNPTILNVEPSEDYAQITCGVCKGSRKIELPNKHTMQCVECKGTGKEWINLI